ncbi:MAG TPA: TlpA disulfide reductase family protein [Candidatus Eisenbacteria bacterium]|nr:TlpA disulfide reductase family protein [Candidatus Eisenbacteria bacterium]
MRSANTPLCACALALLVGLAPSAARAGEVRTRIAPSFTVRTLDGKVFRMDGRGGPVVLDFWATWCGPCKATMPHLNHIQERYADDGLVVIGLSVDEDLGPSSVKRFADKLGVRFRLGMAEEKLLDQYGPIRQIPTTFFINRKGEVVRRTVGYLDEETLDTYVQELFGPATTR